MKVIALNRQKQGPLARREAWEGRLYVLPWVLGFLVFTLGPMIASIYFSLTKYSVLSGAEWIGLDNYSRAFTEDRLLRISIYNTIYFTLLSVPINLVASFLTAMLLNVKVRGINMYRTLYYLPVVTPGVASALTWGLLFAGEFGIVNMVLRSFGLQPVNWFYNPSITKLVFVIMGLWGVAGGAVIFLGGLRNVPQELYEAASIDGANAWRRFWAITLPLMTPLIFFNLIIGIIGTFQVFTGAYVLTRGGPANSTLFYVLHLYNNAFVYFRMGYASALAWILFVIILVFTVIQFRVARKWVYYEADRR